MDYEKTGLMLFAKSKQHEFRFKVPIYKDKYGVEVVNLSGKFYDVSVIKERADVCRITEE